MNEIKRCEAIVNYLIACKVQGKDPIFFYLTDAEYKERMQYWRGLGSSGVTGITIGNTGMSADKVNYGGFEFYYINVENAVHIA